MLERHETDQIVEQKPANPENSPQHSKEYKPVIEILVASDSDAEAHVQSTPDDRKVAESL